MVRGAGVFSSAPRAYCVRLPRASVIRGFSIAVGAGQAARTHSYVSDARKAHASLGDTVTTVSVIPTGPGAAGVISPNFFLFVTTIGVIVS